jgi:hypothetical protein
MVAVMPHRGALQMPDNLEVTLKFLEVKPRFCEAQANAYTSCTYEGSGLPPKRNVRHLRFSYLSHQTHEPMSNIVPFRRGQRAPAQFQPAARQVGRGTKMAAAAQLVNAAVGVVSRLPARRRAGRGGGGQPAGGATGNRRRPRRALQMPANMLYQERGGRTNFTGMSTKALQKKAWEYHPATSNLMAPRGLGYYDAFAMNCSSAVTSMTIGPTTPITGITVIPRISTDYSVTDATVGNLNDADAQLLIIGPSRGRTQARLWKANGAGGSPPAYYNTALHEDFDCPQLTLDQPVDGIPARCSVQVKNFSNAFSRGGRVRILRATTGRTLIPELTTNADLWELMEGIRSHWRTATYDGEDFAGKGSTSMQKNSIVLDQTRTLQFGAFDIHKPLHESGLWWEIQRYSGDTEHGTVPTGHDPAVAIDANTLVQLEEEAELGGVHIHSNGFLAETSAAKQHPHAKNVPDIDAFTEYTANPTFTPIMILFEPCVTGTSNGLIGNEYEVKVCSQFHCHFKQGSTLANMAKEPRTSLGAVNSATHQEEALGSYMRRAAANELKFQRQRMFGV